MDEDHEGNGHRARPGDKATYRVEIHRVNDFVLGHVGQVSYRPVADNDVAVGDLGSGRIDEQREFLEPRLVVICTSILILATTAPSFQQLVSFEEWFAPTRTSLALPTSTTFQRTKSQRNWLFKTHAEALLGNLDLPRLISEETRAQYSGISQTQAGSLLAVGEIFDLRNTGSSRSATCPVIALAAGEAGHILQLSVINQEEWCWGESSLTVGASQARFQGSWCSDGSSISKIEFATKLKQYDTIHWLVAQKDTSTTIFAPELRAKPVAGAASMSGLDDGTADHIAMNPVTTLTANATGGESHCDFSINLGSNDLAPQLAIIDRSGNWSVWYIGRDGHGRSRKTKAVLMKKGDWAFPTSDLGQLGDMHRIAWTTRSGRVDEWERDSSPSTHIEPLAGGFQAAYLTDFDHSRPKYDGLLMCNHTQLQVVDVDGKRLPSWLDFLRRIGTDTILDARTFYGSSSHVFVLTTEKLYLLEVSAVEGQESKSPHVLASCRHFRANPQETLKISVTRLRPVYGESSALVAVHSAQSFRVDLFWFIITERDGIARFHRQVVHFPGLSTGSLGESQGIESLVAVPLHPATSRERGRQATQGDTDQNAHAADAQLYQLFALTADLSLSSSIVAFARGFQQHLAVPVKFDGLQWTDERRARFLRRKWLRESEQAFVIPDKPELVKPYSVVHPPSRTDGYDTIQLRFYLVKLVQEINKAFAGDAAEASVSLTGAEYFKPIRKAMKSREEDDHVALKPIFSFSDLWQRIHLTTIDDEWNFTLRRLSKSEQAQIFDCGHYGSKQSVMDLFEKMSVNWSATIPAESFKPSQWRYMELALERMATEVYLSEKGVYAVPQATLDLASKSVPQDERQVQDEDDLHDFPSSQPRSSQILHTPSATPSSSRATSEAIDSTTNSQDDEATGLEDPAVSRLRMYLPSIKFTTAPKSGPSRVISLWPEQRNTDPSEYRYRAPGQGPDERAEERQRRRERQEQRRQRREEKFAQLGIKMEGAGASYSQPYRPTMIRSSPPPQDNGTSQHQAHSQGFGGFGFGSQSQSQSLTFSQGFGFSQAMSQPLPGEFGSRPSLQKAKTKPKRPGYFK